jgi:hypothetical protein
MNVQKPSRNSSRQEAGIGRVWTKFPLLPDFDDKQGWPVCQKDVTGKVI